MATIRRMSHFDLGNYWNFFPAALKERYGTDFGEGFKRIGLQFRAISAGRRDLSIEDVLTIFDEDLPYVKDWTKPDREDLEQRMNTHGAGKLIGALRDARNDILLVRKIIYCFRDLSLAALILHHVYPDRFALCSHHLASQLYIAAPTVPEFYIKYCEELKVWGTHKWPTAVEEFTVAKVEFSLWTWYRLAHHGKSIERRRCKREFAKDPWIQERRAAQVSGALGEIEPLVLAKAFARTNREVAALIAWRELDAKVHKMLVNRQVRVDKSDNIWARFDKLCDGELPPGWNSADLKEIWNQRNAVVHNGAQLMGEETISEILSNVDTFISHNTPSGECSD